MDIRLDYSDMELITEKAFSIFERSYLEEVKNKGFISVIISGGKSPLSFYSKLNADKNIDFSKIFFFISDERVTKDRSELNYESIEKTLFSGKKEYNFKKINLETDNPKICYSKEIEDFLKEYEVFDISFLGVGPDGHLASLFKPDYGTEEKVIETVAQGYKTADRISLNFSVLNKAKQTIFIISGKGKDKVASDIIKGDIKNYPISGIATPKCYLIDSNSVNINL
ncbi:MAG: 6-phosphogluconolactonase [Elusimicrobiales bacterium]|nr:6-phosphogluconolactonase [Elusimicrobiales bacterium]HOL62087.1 6-phosphogluconolactonase [Elusimicrobiales bacterium]HPO94415.1 6-phosphogluconolactonase [Elusimicrobiales bacterium]